MAEHRVVVVGAGIGGMVAGLLLSARGLDVTVVDAASSPGGKMRPVMVDGLPIDAGPTVFTMRWVFDELLAEVGSSVEEALPPLERLPILARHAWVADGSRLDLHADPARSAEEIAAFSSPAEARRFLAFCDEARRVYRQLEGPHIRSDRPDFWRMVADLGPRGLAALAGLGPLASLASSLARRFEDDRLRQLFGRYATYCGASPWLAPATLMLVAHVEQEGVWSVRGGMAALADSVAALLTRRGATLRLGVACERIEHRQGRVAAVHLAAGERLSADTVVYAGDASALRTLAPGAADQVPRPVAPQRRSLSAMTWAMHVRTRGFPLSRHNVFFDGRYDSEFDDIFRQRRLPRRATVYVCAQDRLAGGEAVPGRERLLALVNAPPDGDTHSFDDREADACQDRCLQLLSRCGLQIEALSPQRVLRRSPADFATMFPATGGALYGEASHGWMALFRRPAARTGLQGLVLAGGSVHPGPGVPMAAMSGRLAAATVMARLDSTRRSHPVRISGGTSMRSATTAGTP